jgi:SAM-dependent methyltransferase
MTSEDVTLGAFLETRKTSPYGFTREYYDRGCIWAKNYWNDEQLARAKKTVALLPRDSWSILDVGCGAGIVTREFKHLFPYVVGIDFASEPLTQIRDIGIAAIQGDVCFLPIKDQSFDAIVATELIEHLSETGRRRTLKEMARVTRRYILITVPYREVLEQGQVKCAECGCVFHAYRHTMSFHEQDMRKLLDPEFRVVAIEKFGPSSKRIPRPYFMLAQIFGGYAEANRITVICPQCGNRDRYVNHRNAMTRILLGTPRRFLPLAKRPSWMAVLYERCV